MLQAGGYQPPAEWKNHSNLLLYLKGKDSHRPDNVTDVDQDDEDDEVAFYASFVSREALSERENGAGVRATPSTSERGEVRKRTKLNGFLKRQLRRNLMRC